MRYTEEGTQMRAGAPSLQENNVAYGRRRPCFNVSYTKTQLKMNFSQMHINSGDLLQQIIII